MTTRTLTACLLLSATALAQPQNPLLDPLRWDVPYAIPDFLGTPTSVAVGDDGALVAVARIGDKGGFDLHAGGSAELLWSERFDQYVSVVRVAVADHAPVAATFTVMDVDPDPSVSLLEARMRVLEVESGVVEAWSVPILTGSGWYWDAGGVAVSDDGEVVVGWWDSTDQDFARLVAYQRDGTLITQVDLPMNVSGYKTGGVRLSDDGSRALVPIIDRVTLIDVASGAQLAAYKTPTGKPLEGVALSGDGRRFAATSRDRLVVLEEGAGGAWSMALDLPQVGDEHYGHLVLDEDGGRLAYSINHISPSDGFEVVLLDLELGAELWHMTRSEPLSWQSLHVEDLAIDAAGTTVACASLGDSEFSTPQVLVMDAAGTVVSEHLLGGSALDVDLDPRGEVLAVAGSPKHGPATVGGRVLLADARAPTLRVLGVPTVGEPLDVTLAGPAAGGTALLLVATELGGTPTPFGTSALDLGHGLQRLGPWPLVGGLAQEALVLDDDPQLAGTLLHLQALVLAPTGGRLSNKVSLRVLL